MFQNTFRNRLKFLKLYITFKYNLKQFYVYEIVLYIFKSNFKKMFMKLYQDLKSISKYFGIVVNIHNNFKKKFNVSKISFGYKTGL